MSRTEGLLCSYCRVGWVPWVPSKCPHCGRRLTYVCKGWPRHIQELMDEEDREVKALLESAVKG